MEGSEISMREIIRDALLNKDRHTNFGEAVEIIAARLQEAGYRKDDIVKGTADAGQEIAEECDRIKEMLIMKNRKYGNSAIAPLRVFSKADPIEQLNVRLDDKLSRLRAAQADEDEDVEQDLIGYLILKRVAKRVSRGGA